MYLSIAAMRAEHARIRGRQEAHRRQQQDAGIEHLRAIGFDEAFSSRSKPFSQTSRWMVSRNAPPLIERRLEAERLGALDAAVERDPCHHLRRYVMLAVAAALPDATGPADPRSSAR